MSEEKEQRPLRSLAPPDPPLPVKTWRGTVLIGAVVLVFLGLFAFLLFRWAQLQTFSPELRFEGYHRFSGVLLAPLPVFGTDLFKLRVRAEDGEELIFPPVPDVKTGAPSLLSYPAGTCVTGFVRHHKGYLAEMGLALSGLDYHFDGDLGWMVTRADEAP